MNSLEDHPDELLLERIAQRDKAAFRLFYERHVSSLRRSIQKLGADGELVSEVVQDTFLTIWTKADTYESERGKPGTWLVTIARNRLFDQWRKIRRDLAESEPGGSLHLLEIFESGEMDLQLGLKSAIEALSPEQRELTRMIYNQGHTLKECAEILNKPLGTIKWRVNVIHNLLRETMQTLPPAGEMKEELK